MRQKVELLRVHEASRHELSMAGFPLARERPVARWPQLDGVVGRGRVRRRREGGFGVGEYGGEVGGCLSGNAWARWGHEPLGRESNSGSQRTPQLSLTHPSSSLPLCVSSPHLPSLAQLPYGEPAHCICAFWRQRRRDRGARRTQDRGRRRPKGNSRDSRPRPAGGDVEGRAAWRQRRQRAMRG